jgi:hypothetical protein
LGKLLDLGGFLGKGQDTRNKSNSYKKGRGLTAKSSGLFLPSDPRAQELLPASNRQPFGRWGASVDACKGRRRSSRVLGVLTAHEDEGRRPDSAGGSGELGHQGRLGQDSDAARSRLGQGARPQALPFIGARAREP